MPKPTQIGRATLFRGNCCAVLPTLGLVDAVVTDPPYGLEFMGKEWDAPWQTSTKSALFGKRNRQTPGWGVTRNPNCRACRGRLRGAKKCACEHPDWDEAPSATQLRQMTAFQDWCEAWARGCFAVLKPGGYLLAFGGTRTHHRVWCAIEDAGFVIQDTIMWLYGQGLPKNRALLKPAWEPIVVAYKPGGARTVQIDECRIPTADNLNGGGYSGNRRHDGTENWRFRNGGAGEFQQPIGRWPANLCHDGSDEVMAAFAAFGNVGGGKGRRGGARRSGYGFGGKLETVGFGDTGTAARFFYCAKASKAEKAGSKHPTIKPLALMRWLVRLVTPPGGVVLDPFAGSGTTGQAALETGRRPILIERELEYIADIRRRLRAVETHAALAA